MSHWKQIHCLASVALNLAQIAAAKDGVISEEELNLIWRLPPVEQVRAIKRLTPAKKIYYAEVFRNFDISKPLEYEFSKYDGRLRNLVAVGDRATLDFLSSIFDTDNYDKKIDTISILLHSRSPEAFSILVKGLFLPEAETVIQSRFTPEYELCCDVFIRLGMNNDFFPDSVKQWFKTIRADDNFIYDRVLIVYEKAEPDLKNKYPLIAERLPSPYKPNAVSVRRREIVREWWIENRVAIEAQAFEKVTPGKRLIAFEGALAPYVEQWKAYEAAYAEMTTRDPILFPKSEPTLIVEKPSKPEESLIAPKSPQRVLESSQSLLWYSSAAIMLLVVILEWKRRRGKRKRALATKKK